MVSSIFPILDFGLLLDIIELHLKKSQLLFHSRVAYHLLDRLSLEVFLLIEEHL